MFCAPGLVFAGTEGVGSRFLVLRSRTRFRWFQGRRVPFPCFALPDSFSGGSEGVGSRFNVLRSRTRFRRFRGRRVPFSCFALPDSFSAVPRASGPVSKLCAPGLVFGSTEGVASCFNDLRSQNHFRRYRGRWVLFSLFALPDSFWAEPRASCPNFMFCVLGFVFGGTEGEESRFHVLRSRIRFRRYRGRRVPFSCFALQDSFSTVSRASAPVFMFCVPGLFFDGTEGVGSRFHILRFRTRFRRYLGRRVPFSCFALPDSFCAVPRA
jgi:hypothetical protein